MALLDFLAAGYLAKRAHNKRNPRIVTVPDSMEIVGMKPKGMGEYAIRYRKKGDNYTALMIISRGTKARSGGWNFTGVDVVKPVQGV